MPWNRKTTRKDRRLRSRRGQTARGRLARSRDLAFWCEYFRPLIRRTCDDVSREFIEFIAAHPLGDRFYGRQWTPQWTTDPSGINQ